MDSENTTGFKSSTSLVSERDSTTKLNRIGTKKGKLHRPTIKQITALKYINQGMSKRQAMLKAGYSPKSAKRPGKKLYGAKNFNLLLDRLNNELVEEGLTTKYIAHKFKEWLEAQKVHTSHTEPDREVPDYDVQIKAYDRWNKVMKNDESKAPTGHIKRQMTVTEFVMGTEPKYGEEEE